MVSNLLHLQLIFIILWWVLHLWLTFITVMVSITIMIFITFMDDTRVCIISFDVHACRSSWKRNYSSYITKKTVGFKRGSKK